jgi:hypothetical protein
MFPISLSQTRCSCSVPTKTHNMAYDPNFFLDSHGNFPSPYGDQFGLGWVSQDVGATDSVEDYSSLPTSQAAGMKKALLNVYR